MAGFKFGPTVTHSPNEITYKLVREIRADVIKIVTGWGEPRGWNTLTRAQILAYTRDTVVRTTCGDPSNKKANPYTVTSEVLYEVAPWLEIKPHCYVELGNEPNIEDSPEHRPPEIVLWETRYWLNDAIDRVRAEYPYARIIAPALILGRGTAERWLEILGDALERADLIGVHLYEHYGFEGARPATTGQVEEARRLYARFRKPLAITEIGVNDGGVPRTRKLAEYRRAPELLGRPVELVTYYHLNTLGDIDPQYHLGPS